jgi:mannose-6-phosphate isomerase-like protein (cupin superfamily)
MSSVITAPAPAPYALTESEGERLWVAGDTVRLLAGAAETGGALTAAEASCVPGSGPPLHVHENEDEFLFVVAGMFEFFVGDDMVVLRSGGFVFIPRGTPHRFLCIGDGPGTLIGAFTPGGADAFFREAGRSAVGDGPAPPIDGEEISRTLAAAARHGVRVMAAPPGA